MADIIGNQQRTGTVERHTHRSTSRIAAFRINKSGHERYRLPARLAINERHINHLVAIKLSPIPAAMLPNECAALKFRWHHRAVGEGQPECSDVWSQGEIGGNRARYHLGPLGVNTDVYVLPVI